MIRVRIKGKCIYFPNRNLIKEVKDLLVVGDGVSIELVRKYASRYQTPRAKVYQQLVRENLI